MFFRKKVLAAKTEGSYGTLTSPVGSSTVLTKNLSIQPYAGPTVSRDIDRSTLGGEEVINTAPSVQITFDIELAGSGTAGTAPGWAPILLACGFDETYDASPATEIEYGPVSSSFNSVTLEFFLDGQVHRVLGARGNMSLSLTRGQLPMMSFTFIGLYTRAEAATLPSDATGYIAPVAVTNDNTPTFSVFSTNVVAESFQFNMNNNIVHRNIIGSDSVLITDRNVTGSMAIEAPAIGTKNWFTDVESDSGTTTGAVQVVHGTSTGNIITIDAPKVQLSSIEVADSDGIVLYNMGAMFIPSSGDDEVTITVA